MSIVGASLRWVRMFHPDVEDVRVNAVEIDGDEAVVEISARLPRRPEMIHMKVLVGDDDA